MRISGLLPSLVPRGSDQLIRQHDGFLLDFRSVSFGGEILRHRNFPPIPVAELLAGSCNTDIHRFPVGVIGRDGLAAQLLHPLTHHLLALCVRQPLQQRGIQIDTLAVIRPVLPLDLPDRIPDIGVCRGGLVVHVFELAAVEGDIYRCVVIFAFNDISVVSQHLTGSLQHSSGISHAIGQFCQNLAVAVAGGHGSPQRVLYRPIIPRTGRISHAALGIIIQHKVIPCGVNRLDELPHLRRGQRYLPVAQGLFHVQIALQQLATLLGIPLGHRLIVREVKALSFRAAVLAHKVCGEFREYSAASVVHHLQTALSIPHLAVLEVVLLRLRQAPTFAVPQQELILYSPLILRASSRSSSAVASR